MKHQHTHLYRWLAGTLATLALTACTTADPLTEGNLLPADHDLLLRLTPETPIALATTLTAYGNSSTRTVTTANALAAIPAKGEITTNTPIAQKDEEMLDNAYAELSLPGASNLGSTALNLYGSTATEIGNCLMYTSENNMLGGDGRLRLYHFNLSATNAAGEKQPHSRMGIIRIHNSNDALIGYARLGTKADGTATGYADFNFKLQHAVAKVSVLLVNVTDSPIEVTDATLKSAAIQTMPSAVEHIYTGATDASGAYPKLADYLRTKGTDGNYPDDLSLLTANTGLAIYSDKSDLQDFALTHPTDANVPTNLINSLLPANATHSISSGSSVYTPLAGSPRLYTDKEVLSVTLYPTTLGSKEITYTLPLNQITLTGLPDGDPRKANGRLTFLRPGEHLCLTIKTDNALQAIAGTATINTWSTGEASEDMTGDEAQQPVD